MGYLVNGGVKPIKKREIKVPKKGAKKVAKKGVKKVAKKRVKSKSGGRGGPFWTRGGKKEYTDEDFSKDLRQLEEMIENYSGGMQDMDMDMQDMDSSDKDVVGVNDVYNNNIASNAGMFGGKKPKSKKVKKDKKMKKEKKEKKEKPSERHFRVISIDGKEVSFGTITSRSPLNAAKKCLRSIAAYKGLTGSAKLNMKDVVFEIREITNRSYKDFGPYIGKYKKYTPEELKKAVTAGGKVKHTMKSVVKLYKGHSKSAMKGGK